MYWKVVEGVRTKGSIESPGEWGNVAFDAPKELIQLTGIISTHPITLKGWTWQGDGVYLTHSLV